MITVAPTPADVVAIYERMGAERLLGRVLHEGASLEEFREIAAGKFFFVEKEDSGESGGFWWLTPFYATAMCFHGCAFRSHRAEAVELMRAAFKRLAAQGVSDLYAFSEHRDVAGFLKRLGFEPVSKINQEITVWAVSLT